MTAAIIKRKLSLTSTGIHSFVLNWQVYSTSLSKEQVHGDVVRLKKGC